MYSFRFVGFFCGIWLSPVLNDSLGRKSWFAFDPIILVKTRRSENLNEQKHPSFPVHWKNVLLKKHWVFENKNSGKCLNCYLNKCWKIENGNEPTGSFLSSSFFCPYNTRTGESDDDVRFSGTLYLLTSKMKRSNWIVLKWIYVVCKAYVEICFKEEWWSQTYWIYLRLWFNSWECGDGSPFFSSSEEQSHPFSPLFLFKPTFSIFRFSFFLSKKGWNSTFKNSIFRSENFYTYRVPIAKLLQTCKKRLSPLAHFKFQFPSYGFSKNHLLPPQFWKIQSINFSNLKFKKKFSPNFFSTKKLCTYSRKSKRDF